MWSVTSYPRCHGDAVGVFEVVGALPHLVRHLAELVGRPVQLMEIVIEQLSTQVPVSRVGVRSRSREFCNIDSSDEQLINSAGERSQRSRLAVGLTGGCDGRDGMNGSSCPLWTPARRQGSGTSPRTTAG